MSERAMVEILRAVVADLRPAESADFDLVATAAAASPGAVARARRGADEPTASGFTIAGELFVTIVTGVGLDLCKDMIKSGVSGATRKAVTWARRRRVDLQTVAPPVVAEDVPALTAKATSLATDRGLSEEDAAVLARALLAQWNRR